MSVRPSCPNLQCMTHTTQALVSERNSSEDFETAGAGAFPVTRRWLKVRWGG